MGVYDRQIAQAQRMIKAKGQLVAWVSKDQTAPADADEPWNAGTDNPTPTQHAVYMVFLPPGGGAYNSALAQLARALGAKEIATGTVVGLMGAVDFVPDETDVIIRGGVQLRINTLDVLSPNGDPILYTVGLAV